LTTFTFEPKFDLACFSRAFELHDAQTQVQYYADEADVCIVRHHHRTAPLHTIRGRSEILSWLTALFDEFCQVRAVQQIDGEEEVALIAECRRPDGTFAVYACTLMIVDGRVLHQYVVLLEDSGVRVAPLRDHGRLLMPVF